MLQNKKGAGTYSAPLMIALLGLFVQLISLLEPFYPTGCINHLSFTRKERMAFAAKLYSELFLCRTDSENITA
jgi:hypothetical protein